LFSQVSNINVSSLDCSSVKIKLSNVDDEIDEEDESLVMVLVHIKIKL